MDNKSKGDIIAGTGGAILGGICGVDLLRINPANDWMILIIQFLGVLFSAGMTSMVMIVFKYFGESIVEWMKEYAKKRRAKRNSSNNKNAA